MTATAFEIAGESRLELGVPRSCPTTAEQERTKVAALFADRRIVSNMKMGELDSETQQALSEKLQSLQASIYRLDRYGETNWEVQEAVLRQFWRPIRENLRTFYSTDAEVQEAVREIRAYQRIEVGLRQRHDPTAIPIHQFYSLKTCDVRLSRRLIATASDCKVLQSLTPFWNCYDLASEICDDLTDVHEDARDFNCNRFLISRAVLGDEKTAKQYSAFLHDLLQRAVSLRKSFCDSGQAESRLLFAWTVDAIRNARRLLHRNLAVEGQLLLRLPILQFNPFAQRCSTVTTSPPFTLRLDCRLEASRLIAL